MALKHKVIMVVGALYAVFVLWVVVTDVDVKFLCKHEVITDGCAKK